MKNAESQVQLELLTPKLSGLRYDVLHTISQLRTATAKEITRHTGMHRITVGSRMCELKKAGLIAPTDRVTERCRALALTDEGKRVFAA